MTIDLDSDLGEGLGSWSMGGDEALVSNVISTNAAWGFHTADPPIMRQVTARVADLWVARCANVGYRDHTRFGRRFIEVKATVLTVQAVYHVGALDEMTRRHGHGATCVKPYRALHRVIVTREEQAAQQEPGGLRVRRPPGLMGLPGSRARPDPREDVLVVTAGARCPGASRFAPPN